jgi:hypothetical protein
MLTLSTYFLSWNSLQSVQAYGNMMEIVRKKRKEGNLALYCL